MNDAYRGDSVRQNIGMPALDRIERAFDRLAERSGFVARDNQRQLALLLSDLIESGSRGLFEAPTGLGKSLASLIPAFAHAIENKKRVVIATYTNVLAEQYWDKDIPLAQSLFDEKVSAALLMGRQRYLCLQALDEAEPRLVDLAQDNLSLGIESEFRLISGRGPRETNDLWKKVAVPPVCAARQCPLYQDCYYYESRRQAESASVVVTNHSVVIQDALMRGKDGNGLLGKYDFLILDEAHDFLSAAENGLELELSRTSIAGLQGMVTRMEKVISPAAVKSGVVREWNHRVVQIRKSLDELDRRLNGLGLDDTGLGIIRVTPAELSEHPGVKQTSPPSGPETAMQIAQDASEMIGTFVADTERTVGEIRAVHPDTFLSQREMLRSYLNYFKDAAASATAIFRTEGTAVSYSSKNFTGGYLRQDILNLAPVLKELIWEPIPFACLSATLALDGSMDFYKRLTGAEADFEEILPSPFDFASQASTYVPAVGQIPDPTIARREGREDEYHRAVARQVVEIINACRGRTLALFHSRKEMDAVYQYAQPMIDYPVVMQGKYGNANLGDKFRAKPEVSLFALRSFWTGFDAPGETLSCVILVRVPFEVPMEPTAIARIAWLQSQGQDPFRDYALANAKMLMRQGAGRLIRQDGDRGVICLLDPRLRTKNYGQEILDNLPSDMRQFSDIADAVGWIGLE